jgi:thiosulfate/3-mercaptopyruvate sulfurtransferase
MEYSTLIDVASLRELLERPASTRVPSLIVDCRFDLSSPGAGRRAFLAQHIPGAHYWDLDEDLSAPRSSESGRHPLPSPDALAERLSDLNVDSHTQVVVYDEANGSFAARAWWLLRWIGAERVAVLDGGFKAWMRAGGAVESDRRAPTPPAGSDHVQRRDKFLPRVHRDAVLSAAEVERALLDPRRLLVDARAPARFSGRVEPIDPVAGHVPGAVNHPFTENLRDDGHFLPPDELRRRWQQRLGSTTPESVILMCGSGVTACHNALAMTVAGLPGAKLYAGSWSEWIRDPNRPVAAHRPAAD